MGVMNPQDEAAWQRPQPGGPVYDYDDCPAHALLVSKESCSSSYQLAREQFSYELGRQYEPPSFFSPEQTRAACSHTLVRELPAKLAFQQALDLVVEDYLASCRDAVKRAGW
jgi:hypothetical protein